MPSPALTWSSTATSTSRRARTPGSRRSRCRTRPRPHHDWNERITAECYAPNTAARRLDAPNRILDIVNNYERISFNVGPTLFAWLARERARRRTRQIVEADRASVAGARRARQRDRAGLQPHDHAARLPARQGHAGALGHRGLPPALRPRAGGHVAARDRGRRRDARGARRGRASASRSWRRTRPWRVRPLDGGEDAWTRRRRPHRSRAARTSGAAPSGAHARALLLRRADLARDRLRGPAAQRRRPRRPAARGLRRRARPGRSSSTSRPTASPTATTAASATWRSPPRSSDLSARTRRSTLTNYGEYLAARPADARGRDPRAHVLELRPRRRALARRLRLPRERRRPHQRWRAPAARGARLAARQRRRALRGARRAAPEGPVAGARRLRRRRARPHAGARGEFLDRHARAPLDEAARVEALRLLELQRNRLLMYTSCGWFFDELSGHRDRADPAVRGPGRSSTRASSAAARSRTEFVRRLQAAPTNVPEMPDGADVYRRLVRPAAVDLRRVAAHYAISSVLERYPDVAPIYAYEVARLDEARRGVPGHGGARRPRARDRRR